MVFWIFSELVKTLCARCANSDHKAKDCEVRTKSRKIILQFVLKQYKHFQPAGHVNNSNNRRFISRLRSHSRLRSYHNNNDQRSDSNNTNVNKTVTYAEATVSDSLNQLIHAPHKYTNSH